jgi:hypothetical protein
VPLEKPAGELQNKKDADVQVFFGRARVYLFPSRQKPEAKFF